MRRREFGAALGALMTTSIAATVSQEDQAAAIRQAIENNYALYRGNDVDAYRATLAPDYVLLEHGELMGAADDVENMKTRPPGFTRTDAFDFNSVTIEGPLAYAVYFLTSQIADEKRQIERRWLESAILRRSGDRWLMALLHSTRIEKPKPAG
jgi:ketosteroid isomerase-like protein